ncbi:hypothetical protein NDU88_010912 [Pleurodeles waltl]|uniref:Uncharacterized protein n=1 Tax=Pleurodeles waltl TaxID=8319 RepID=A0AAV7S4M5_PLEWA|nr:hypothetical protein NDU88_010912 [Pleurodeles waltl]
MEGWGAQEGIDSSPRSKFPVRVYGDPAVGRAGKDVGGFPGEPSAWGVSWGLGEEFGSSGGCFEMGGSQPCTLDLRWQEEADLGGGEPGEQCAALRPWREEKAEPRAAG